MATARAARLLATLSLTLAAACKNAPIRDDATLYLPSDGLEVVRPVEIAVAPVQDHTATSALPLDQLRADLCRGLVTRLYTPLGPAFFDRRTLDASFSPSEVGADAVLHVSVEDWNDSRLSTSGVIGVRAVATLIDAENPGGAPLWAVDLQRRLDVGRPTDPGRTSAQHAEAARRLAAEIAALLPERAAAAGVP